MPDPRKLKESKSLSFLGDWLHDPGLWHMNRHSVSGAFAVGLFMAWVPIPFQMLLAAVAAILFRVNIGISIGLVWITNPVTIPPMFYGAYLVGAYILGIETMDVDFNLSMEALSSNLSSIWLPFLTGCLLMAVSWAAVGYGLILGLWRYHLIQRLKERKNHRKQRENKPPLP